MSSFTDDQLRILEKSVIECRDVNILLGDFVSEELPQCLTQRLNEHILECDSCKESVENYKVGIIL